MTGSQKYGWILVVIQGIPHPAMNTETFPITPSARGKDNIFFRLFHPKNRTSQFLERKPAFAGDMFQCLVQKISE